MKRLRAGVFLFLAGVYCAPLHAETPTLMSVATCTGRLSALLEQQWTAQDPRASKTEAVRNHMTDLLFAIITPETDRMGRAWRADAKRSFQSLLDRMPTEAPGSKSERMAAQKARQDITICAAMILPRDEIDARFGWTEQAPLVIVAPERAWQIAQHPLPMAGK